MGRFARHIFVCVNERAADHPKGSCAAKGSAEVRDFLKAELKKRGLSRIVRSNNAGCLDACEHGVSMVIYPEGIWYAKVKREDVPEIIDRTIIGGEVIQRLLSPDPRCTPSFLQYPRIEGDQ